MPNYGLGAAAEGLLTKWEAAQAARYSAWTSAPSVIDGVIAVAKTGGSMIRGTGGASLSFAGAAGRWIAGPAGPGTMFRDTALAVIEPIRSRLFGHGVGHQSYPADVRFR